MVQRLVLKKGHIEFFAHQRLADMAGQRAMTANGWNIARTTTFVGHFVFFAHTQRESRVVIKEERGHMVVVDHEQHIRFALFDPLLHRLEAFKNRSPYRVALLVAIDGKAYGGGMRCSYRANDLCHVLISLNKRQPYVAAKRDIVRKPSPHGKMLSSAAR